MRKWLFSQGTQAADWLETMCGTCVNGSTSEDQFPCKAEEAVNWAWILGDQIPVPEEFEERRGDYRCYDCNNYKPKPCEQCGGAMDKQRHPWRCNQCAGDEKGPGYQK